MKAALDLPDELAREVRVHAAQRGRKLKDVIADLLRRGLDAAIDSDPAPPMLLVRDPNTGLPTVACRHPARAADRPTPGRIAKILMDQEAEWNHEARR